jgi:hypothetical protein
MQWQTCIINEQLIFTWFLYELQNWVGNKNTFVSHVIILVVYTSVSSFYILVTFTSFLPISKVIALLVDLRELCNESKNSQLVSL